ncbi:MULTISPECIES: DEAD/DEAH box helicase family protein [Streptococcus]|uniref:Restriction endonuclease subunit R n=2 Tax=Streptococcus salivarius TaxID=1304 RepID=A0A074IVI2_STRSL|nr:MULTISPECIES: DEAD/DEAH box helicase family protein [Streptococcus]KEO43779.1 restriction endonuclease subunit R [Streptococcus salivarius]KEO44267.1 restriction endonuclease subunit R [Streptococcus salivarius]MBK5024824.1 DEAD/DEAH box helicase family protein [Streptococcus sp. 17.1]MBK5033255.1 DEAD/DEAH box helicase family protein [Streptococcus sp. 15.1]MBK5141198.1 DEAD/DEAH box helicase family protein [Streptococcus sp. 16.1]
MLDQLSFKGQWRQYQQRILDKSESFMGDGKIHLVAAPGSGKTTLGIEFIRRFGNPTLILVPTVTIRQQWVDRIKQAFLSDANQAEQLISQDLKRPKMITVATYQALHSSMNQVVGDGLIEDTDDTAQQEHFNFQDFDIRKTFEDKDLGTLCLDECHHLRNEWWKSLEIFRKSFPKIKMISLTATPPYEGEPALWERYISMCGEIDEEITVPELVKEGTLCPHQDYVYFAFPTMEERTQLDQFEKQKLNFLTKLSTDINFSNTIQSSPALSNQISDDELLANPKYLSAILIFLRSKELPFPQRFQELLAAKALPTFTLEWFETLLNGIIFQVPNWFGFTEEALNQLKSDLKANGLIERNQVKLIRNKKQDVLLNQSLGKLNAVRDIFKAEYQALGSNLRQLVLTDFIRKDFQVHLGDKNAQFTQLGVLSYFESIRREMIEQSWTVPVAVLTGSLVIIPTSAKEHLERLIPNSRLSYDVIGQLSQEDYLKVSISGSYHDLVTALTQLFQDGYIKVIIGTKSLLGEGWDAPCVNSLILASFVGSFMLSNQMRGRAIRVWPDNPNKTSNIWHLVSINLSPRRWFEFQDDEEKYDETLELRLYGLSPDLDLLDRRMTQFLGLHYQEPTIESGIDRLDLNQLTFSQKGLEKLNQNAITLSQKRQELKDRWQEALPLNEEMEVANEVEVDKQFLPLAYLNDWKKALLLFQALVVSFNIYDASKYVIGGSLSNFNLTILLLAVIALAIVWGRYAIYKSPYKRLEVFGEAIHQALLDAGQIETKESAPRVVRDSKQALYNAIYLKGASMKEKEIFAQAITEFFAPIENQRYILKASRKVVDQTEYFAVPSMFERRKDDATAFLERIQKSVGKYDLIYTRSAQGRPILLEARIKALGNKQERTITRKKVMSSLE